MWGYNRNKFINNVLKSQCDKQNKYDYFHNMTKDFLKFNFLIVSILQIDMIVFYFVFYQVKKRNLGLTNI